MSRTWGKEYRQFIFSLYAKPVNRHIMNACIRMGCITHSQGNVRSRIHRSISRSRNQFIQVKIRFICLMNHFLARSWREDFHWRYGFCHTLIQHFSKIFRFTAKQYRYSFSTCKKADCHFRLGMIFYIVKNHCGTFFRRPFHSPASSHITVNSSQLCLWIYFHVCFYQLSWYFF